MSAGPHPPEELFRRWFEQPLGALRELPDGDGGIAAIALSCVLYERYAAAIIKESGSANDVPAQLAADFGVPEDAARLFWDIVRNGLLHQGMPKALDRRGKPLAQWLTTHELPDAIRLERNVLLFQPWHFSSRVLELWRSRPDLINASAAFPLATIVYTPDTTE